MVKTTTKLVDINIKLYKKSSCIAPLEEIVLLLVLYRYSLDTKDDFFTLIVSQ